MRNLNLSRLARASESAYFKDTQSTQASILRKKLTKPELDTLQQQHQNRISNPNPTIDVLPEISAHRAYTPHTSRVVDSSTASTPSHIISRMQMNTKTNLSSTTLKPDPPVLRALGSGRLQLYSSLQQSNSQQVHTLPGSAKYADGAVLGLASFSVATAIVASVGLAGVLLVYLRPQVITSMKESTQRFRDRMDRTVGKRMRERVEQVRNKGPLIADGHRQKATEFAHGAVGIRAEKEVSGEEKLSGIDQ